MSNIERLKSYICERLGDAYTVDIGDRVTEVSKEFIRTRFELSQEAMQGQIDGETFAIRLNDAASKANADLRSILGGHFDDVFGIDENFMLAEPAIAKEIDYSQIPKDALVTPDDVTEVLKDPMCVDILYHLSNQSLAVEALAKNLKRSPEELPDRLRLLQRAQLVGGRTEKSVTTRVRQVPVVHGGSYSLLIADDSGVGRLCWLSPPTGMDRDDALQVETELTGQWTYSCLADAESPGFNDEEAGRGGIMNIKAYANSLGGIDAAIEAERHWYVRPNGKNRKKIEIDPKPWHSKGGVSVRVDRILFEYSIDNEFGKTQDSYIIGADPLEELNGRFVHTRTDQVRVFGTVTLVKQSSPEPSETISPELAPLGR